VRHSCTPVGGVHGFDYGTFLLSIETPVSLPTVMRCLCDGDQGNVDGGEYFLRTLNAVMTRRTVLCRIRAWREGGTGSALAQRLAILDWFLGVLQSFLVCAGIVPHIRPRLLPFTPVRSSTLRSVIALSTVIRK